ncbi:hypothetical protein [uncultured Metabacillus sp.]|uniref:hypothetical protein n=1 Tax=Metabacillus sp. Hm71 TaxID=3450743 RepID=UPI002614819B|nr:hypothetical protein [uncultured Metabacillus sp.]
MAFGISRKELVKWKDEVSRGEISFLTHFWLDDRFPNLHCVTKAGCSDIEKLATWGAQFGLKKEWIHYNDHYPHFDLLGETQLHILKHYGLEDHIQRFKLQNKN